MWKLFVLDKNPRYHITVCKQRIKQIKDAILKDSMEHWKYSYDYNQTNEQQIN